MNFLNSCFIVPGRPVKMNAKSFVSDHKLVIGWRPPSENPTCVQNYRYSLTYDSAKFDNKTNNNTLVLPFKPCVAYSINVWSVGPNDTLSKTAAYFEGVTSALTEMPEVNTRYSTNEIRTKR